MPHRGVALLTRFLVAMSFGRSVRDTKRIGGFFMIDMERGAVPSAAARHFTDLFPE
jgi:hypothetical protein